MEAKSPLTLVDTHCHLNFDVFDSDRESVVERARENGISRILNPGVDIETSESALQCARLFPEVYAAVGVHPNSGSAWTDSTLTRLRELAGESKVVAIGEIGLDYYRHHAPPELQRMVFKKQLDLAAELGLPVIIHNRESSADLLEILADWHQRLVASASPLVEHPGVLHSFSGDLAFAAQLVKLNFKLGINGPLTYKNSHLLQDVVVSVPIEALLVETDSPFLSPEPFRGKRNEPANVRIVAEKIAQLKDETLDSAVDSTSAGADRLFRWREMH